MAFRVPYLNRIHIEHRVVRVDGSGRKYQRHYWEMSPPVCFADRVALSYI